jgi:hypothetical protein
MLDGDVELDDDDEKDDEEEPKEEEVQEEPEEQEGESDNTESAINLEQLISESDKSKTLDLSMKGLTQDDMKTLFSLLRKNNVSE